MTPAGLSAVLVVCLGAGSMDLALLNLAVLPALREAAVQPGVRAARAPRVPLRSLDTQVELASLLPTPRVSAPARKSELVAILEFDKASHRVRRPVASTLQEALTRLRGTAEIVLVGHADASGPAELNERLSGERAQAVARHLTRAGISIKRIRLEALGEREPRLDGNSRRVEIYLGERP